MTNQEAKKILGQYDVSDIHFYTTDGEEIPFDKWSDAIEMAIKALEAQKWIPCSERLPEKDGSYLVSGRWGSGKEMVGECEYKVHDGYFSTAWNFDVLAWKPLPEPYREDEK